MKKFLLLGLCSLGVTMMSSAAEVVFTHDFSNLDGFTTYDIDQKEPSTQAAQVGFEVGKGWIIVEVESESVAASNSSNKQGLDAVEDWLITPALTLTEGNIFSFETYTISFGNSQKVATYKVLLSTTGTAVEDFTVEIAAKESANSSKAVKGYDLSEYAGQTVHLALVNVSRAKDVLIVDNMFVGVPDLFTYEVNYQPIQNDATAQQTLSVSMTSSLKEVFTKVDATITSGDYSDTYTDAACKVIKGGNYTFSFNKPLPTPVAGEAYNFTLTITAENENTTLTEVYNGSVAMQGYQPFKRVLFEEQTGTWCGWCVRGHYFMEKMEEDYPDTYIGVASHTGDVMSLKEYDSYLSRAIGSGAPLGRVDRDSESAGCDPSDFPRLYNKYIKSPAVADIKVAVEWVDDAKQQLKITSYSAFAFNAENFVAPHLEYIVVEDGINRPDEPAYNQANYYAGGANGSMGGYEKLPDEVPAADMVYNDVVRHVITGKTVGKGIADCFPSNIEKGVANSHSVTMDVPENVFDIEKCEFIVLLIDPTTGVVYNSAKNTLAGSSAIENVVAESNVARVYRSLNGVAVDVAVEGNVEINVYSLDGRLVANTAPRFVNAHFTVECPVAGTGVYLVNVVCDGVSSTHKVIL